MAETGGGQAERVWTPLCALTMMAGAAASGGIVWGRGTNARTLALVAAGAAVGALLGYTLRGTGKRRMAALASCLVLAAIMGAGAKYLTSDAWTVWQDWPEHAIGHTTFIYPSRFTERRLAESFISNGEVRVFTNGNARRNASYMVYDFAEGSTYPALDDSLAGAVNGMLGSMKATFIGWDEDMHLSAGGDTICGRFTYTLRNTTYTGLAFAHAAGSHYELLAFYPLTAAYPEAYLERMEGGIRVDGKPPFEEE